MTTYVAVLEKEKGSLWSVWFPDLPGCTTAADTADNAQRRAIEALRLYAEDVQRDGEALPQARPLDAFIDDAEVKASRNAGAIIVSVPLYVTTGTPVRVNISIDSGALRAIDTEAQRRGMTRSAFLMEAAEERILQKA